MNASQDSDREICSWAFSLDIVNVTGWPEKTEPTVMDLVRKMHRLISLGSKPEDVARAVLGFLQQLEHPKMVKEAEMCIERIIGLVSQKHLFIVLETLFRWLLPYHSYFVNLFKNADPLALCLVGGKLQYTSISQGKGNADGVFNWTRTVESGGIVNDPEINFEKSLYCPLQSTLPKNQREARLHTYDVNYSDAITRLTALTSRFPRLLGPTRVLAGGIVKKCLKAMDPGSSDFDVWIIGATTREQLWEELWWCLKYLYTLRGSQFTVTCPGTTVTVTMTFASDASDAHACPVCIQFPMRMFQVIPQVILSFDFHCVQAAFDGRYLHVSRGCEITLRNNICLIDPTMATTLERMLKQHSEGFVVCGPYTEVFHEYEGKLHYIKSVAPDSLYTLLARLGGSMTSMAVVKVLMQGRRQQDLTFTRKGIVFGSAGSVPQHQPHVTWDAVHVSGIDYTLTTMDERMANILQTRAVDACEPGKRMYGGGKPYFDKQFVDTMYQSAVSYRFGTCPRSKEAPF